MNNKEDLWMEINGKRINLSKVKTFIPYFYDDDNTQISGSITFYLDGRHYHQFSFKKFEITELRELIEFLDDYFEIKSYKELINEYKNNININ